MNEKLQAKAASILALKERARRRLPKYVFEYVAGGCITDSAVRANRECLEKLKLQPRYLGTAKTLDTRCNLLGRPYNLPLGVAPIGLSGLIWPRSGEFLAQAARQANIPFVLSTVGTTSIESAAKHAEDNFWFQIYPPPDDTIRLDLVKRTREVGCTHLVVTVDVPALGRRPRDLQNGIAIPPKLNVRTLLQTAMRPTWSLATLATGMPQFANLDPYPLQLQKQFLALAQLRAIETGRDLLSVGNTGPTALISANGSVQWLLPPEARGVAEAVVHVRQRVTPYSRWISPPPRTVSPS